MTVRIRYVGKKPEGVTDLPHMAGTGTVWSEPGNVQEVPDKAAPKLLHHTDSFELADSPTQTGDETPENLETNELDASYQLPKKDEMTEVDRKPPMVDLEAMDENALREFAQQHFNHTFHHKTGEDRMRREIIGLMNREQAA